jgi:hypothetical protein
MRVSRRYAVVGGATAVGGLLAGTSGAGAAVAREATPIASPAPGVDCYLFIGDRTQDVVEIRSIPDGTLVGAIEEVTFGTHSGALLLPNGRLVFADVKRNALLAVAVVDGVPVVTDRVEATFGGGVAWGVADPSLRFVAFGSLIEDSETQILNIVDLESWTNTAVEITMNEPEELHAWILGDPLHLYLAIGGQIQSFTFEDVLAGSVEPLSTIEVDLESHGGVTDVEGQQIFYVTGVGLGFDVLSTANGAAEYVTQIPWDVDGFTGGRNARPRLTADGRHIIGLLVEETEPTAWAERMYTNHVVDTVGLTARRIEVGTGNFGYRYGMNDTFAVWAGYNADGGRVYLIDVADGSTTFGDVVSTFPVEIPANAAVAGEDPEGKDTYATAISAAGDFAIVSINGNRELIVFDPATGEEVNRFETALPLANYDGFITVIEAGIAPVDLWAR